MQISHPLVQAAAVMKGMAEGAAESQEGFAMVSPCPAVCSRTTLALLVLETSSWSETSTC